MKRTPLTRKTGLKSGSSLKRTAWVKRANEPLQRNTPLAPRSPKRAKLYKEERVPLVIFLLTEFPQCQLSAPIRRQQLTYDRCTRLATQVHELKKRSAGGSLVDRRNLLTSCSYCNFYVEIEPDICWQAGLVIRHGETYQDAELRRGILFRD